MNLMELALLLMMITLLIDLCSLNSFLPAR
jgi:hypothetical protein